MERTCKNCGINIDNKRPQAIYCSKNCCHLAWAKKTRPERNTASRTWRNKNKEHCKQYRKSRAEINRRYWKERRAIDPLFRIKNNMRNRLNSIISGKRSSLTQLLGCSEKDFLKHIESQFTKGMTWDNYGVDGWHIDHIKPCAAHDLTDRKQVAECWHYSNLRPLWAEDNLKKWAHYE